jgi:hypothetical protein
VVHACAQALHVVPMSAKSAKSGAHATPISIASFNTSEHYFYRRWLWVQFPWMALAGAAAAAAPSAEVRCWHYCRQAGQVTARTGTDLCECVCVCLCVCVPQRRLRRRGRWGPLRAPRFKCLLAASRRGFGRSRRSAVPCARARSGGPIVVTVTRGGGGRGAERASPGAVCHQRDAAGRYDRLSREGRRRAVEHWWYAAAARGGAVCV